MKRFVWYAFFFTISFTLHNKQKKIPLYAIYTPSHEILKNDWFLPSIKDDYEVKITFAPQEGKGIFRQKDYSDAIIKKIDMILDAIKENQGGVFVYADVDIQFFKPTKKILLKHLKNKDFVIQRDNPEGMICTGFFVSRGNKKTLKLWQEIKEEVLKNRPAILDQDAMNNIIFDTNKKSDLKWDYLPNEFMSGGTLTGKLWNPGNDLPIPENIILHHANFTVGVDNKIAQLKYVKNKAEKTSGQTKENNKKRKRMRGKDGQL